MSTMPPPRAFLSRRRRDKQRFDCLECWFQNVECYQGTIPGCCINCGLAMNRAVVQDAGTFWNEAMTELMSTLTQTIGLRLFTSDIANRDTLTIQTATSTGWSEPRTFELPASYSDNPSSRLDELVRNNYTLHIRQKDSVTHLISQSILARGYFFLLCSASPVVEYERMAQDQDLVQCQNNKLSLYLIHLILAQLDGLITCIMTAMSGSTQDSNSDYGLDVAGAAGILYPVLVYISRGLSSGTFRPICGGDEMSRLLIARCSSIREELIQHQRNSCARFDNWTSHISGSLDEIKSSIYIQDMALTLERHLSPASMANGLGQSPSSPWDHLQHTNFTPEFDRVISSESFETPDASTTMNSPGLGYSPVDQTQEGQLNSPYYENFTWTQN